MAEDSRPSVSQAEERREVQALGSRTLAGMQAVSQAEQRREGMACERLNLAWLAQKLSV